MRISPPSAGAPSLGLAGGCKAFTLPEVMIASSIFHLVLAGVLMGNSFGMRVLSVMQPKLMASGAVRVTVDWLYDDIRSAKYVRIGEGDANSFTNVEEGGLKLGNAIEVHPASNAGTYVRYFLDPTDRTLKRVKEGELGVTIVANAISNDLVFSGRDISGTILTNDQNNMVIVVNLQYFQLAGSGTPVGPGNYYTSYSMENRIACRAR